MTFDPDNPNAHAEARTEPQDPARKGERPPTVARRGPTSDVERWAADALAVMSTDGHQDLPDAVRSIGSQVLAYGPRLSEKQWAYAVSLAERFAKRHALPKPLPPPLRSVLEIESSEVESQLDAVLRDPHGDRCLLAVEEAVGRHESIARALGLGKGADRPLAATPRTEEYGVGVCGSCAIGGVRGCARCSRGEAHPGEPCDSPHRTRFCRGWSLLATLRARILDARGLDGDEIRRDIGLEVAP